MNARRTATPRLLRSPLGRIVRAGVSRRWLPTAVMALTTLLAVAASVLAAGLLVDSRAPFDRAFAAQHGAELTAQFDGAKATPAQLAATAHLAGVTAAAGPFPTASLNPAAGADTHIPPGARLSALSVVGRADPGGSVDAVDLMSGHWATGPGQIVLNTSQGGSRMSLGAQLTFPDLPGDPTLTVVGLANSVSDTANAWVTPAQLTALTTGSTPQYEMLYRFTSAATDAQVNADRAAVAAALPTGALTGSQSWLQVRLSANGSTAAFVPFIAAFGILALAMSVLIVGIVVSSAISSQVRRIGILKALGFTPAQVVRAYIGQALIPATVGTLLGLVAGNLLAVPALHDAESTYGTGTLTVPTWVDAAAAATTPALVTATAWALALRAGRLRTVDAIAVGHTATTRRGRLARRLAGRLPLPRPVVIGLAHPFTRPARSLAITGAVLLGTVAVALAVGLTTSLGAVQSGLQRNHVGDVAVNIGNVAGGAPTGGAATLRKNGGPLVATPAATAQITAAITAQPGTAAYYATARADVGVAGITGGVDVLAYTGDPSWASYQMISGTWLTAPGQVVVPTRFLTATGDHVGDTITLTQGGHQVELRIVGEALDTNDDGMQILTDLSSLDGLDLGLQPEEYDIRLAPGTDLGAYLNNLNAALGTTAFAQANTHDDDAVLIAMEALVALLAAMIVAVAALGVLNLVVLDTRQRVHDLGIYKALGMSPRQTVAMVLTSVAGIGLIAGIIGVPLGVLTHHQVLPLMGAAVGTHIPTADIAVYHWPDLAALTVGGLAIALAAATLPAGWAARTRTQNALRTE